MPASLAAHLGVSIEGVACRIPIVAIARHSAFILISTPEARRVAGGWPSSANEQNVAVAIEVEVPVVVVAHCIAIAGDGAVGVRGEGLAARGAVGDGHRVD